MKIRLGPCTWKDGIKCEAIVLGLILIVTVIRFIYASVLALSGDEAYYWQWSRHLAWGYYDHPPMIAYVIAIGTWIAGITPVGVRFLPIVMAGVTAWMVYRITQVVNPRPEAALWAFALVLFTPIFSSGAVLSTPDSPFVFFWTATLLCTLKALQNTRSGYWTGAGLMMGLGMLSKFSMVLLPVSMILALASTAKGRELVFSARPWLGALAGALLCVPYVIWSIDSGWHSVSYQLGHGLEKSAGSYGLSSFLLFIGGQLGVTALLIFPLVLMAIFHGIGGCFNRKNSEDQRTMLALLTAPALLTLLVFGGASFFTKSGPNWPVAMYPTSFVLAGIMISQWKLKGRVFAFTALSVAALLSVYVLVEIVMPMVPYNPKGFFSKVQDRGEFKIWADEVRNSLGGEGRNALILADSYQLASLLAFYLPDHPETDSPMEKGSGSEYARWRRSWEEGDSAWFFTNKDRAPAYFFQLETAGTLTETRLGKEVDTISAKFGKLKVFQSDKR